MIRIKVFPLKKIIYKLQIVLLIIIFLLTILTLLSLSYKKKNELVREVFNNKIVLESNQNKENIINKLLKNKLRILKTIDYDDIAEKQEQNELNIDSNEKIIDEQDTNNSNFNNIKIDLVEHEKWTKPNTYITELYESGKIRVGNVVISNYSKLSLNLEELKKPSTYNISDNTNFLVFHTHTSETYTIDECEYSDYYRTQNEKYNMLSVGKVLASSLINKGFSCVHEKTVHDYPSYNGAYKASLKTVENCLQNNDFDFIIDIHRDAISSNANYRPTVQINGESVAKLMFVVGTNAAGLEHDNWMENLKLAIMIQNRAEEMYPGLFRELHLSSSRYNQQVSNGALILEVGATGNTLEEAQNAMKYLANVIDSMK